MYVTLDEANIYLNAKQTVADKWSPLSDEHKNLWIEYAMQNIDQQIWIGEKVSHIQPYQFPRRYDEYLTNKRFQNWLPEIQRLLINTNTVTPTNIKLGTLGFIAHGLSTLSFQGLLDFKNAGLPMTKAGSVEFEPTTDDTDLPLPKSVWRLVKYWLSQSRAA